MMKRLFAVALGDLTAIGGFVDIGDLVTNAQVGARFGRSLAWVVLVGVLGTCVFAEMPGLVSALSGRRTPPGRPDSTARGSGRVSAGRRGADPRRGTGSASRFASRCPLEVADVDEGDLQQAQDGHRTETRRGGRGAPADTLRAARPAWGFLTSRECRCQGHALALAARELGDGL